MRECIEITARSLRLRGTAHLPKGGGYSTGEPLKQSAGIGVVFFNSGFLPRAPQGDVTAHQADCIAALGHMAFRFDMPGLGDSEGDLDENALTVVRQIQAGEHAPYALEVASELKHRFSLKGYILAGHCGGAITSIYAGELAPTRDVLGIMVFEPDFRQRIQGQSEPPRGQLLYGAFRAWVLKSRVGALIQTTTHAAKGAAESAAETARAVFRIKAQSTRSAVAQAMPNPASPPPPLSPSTSKPEVPPEANLPLIKAWRAVLGKNFPVLLVTVPVSTTSPSGSEYFGNLLNGSARFLTHVQVLGTNHAFVEGQGRRDVVETTEGWLRRHFPLPQKPKSLESSVERK